ncbi:hypothetical protein [Lysinibacillus sp. FJAT-14222]|uniref:hypothetical protein n=1 Tax=Lysinibacillus sp. FJAT-14222 TaxID=1932366 RepID=UPI0011603B21|nr:hypothetical protein [Lysinibacillus sp. FJAT-14222]
METGRLLGRPQEALRESEATATIVLSVRKRSDSKCFICAKAKRQQMFYLCESEATATIVLSVRKRSDSNNCFICAKATATTNVFCSESKAAATKRPVGTEINHTLW